MNNISPKAKIGKNVQFGSFVTIHDNVHIGDDCVVDSYSELGICNGKEVGPLIIGKNSKIRSHSVIYAGNIIGDNLVTAHFSVIRENNNIGSDFQLGVNSLIQPNCKIGNYVKIISNAMITHNSTIGNFVWVFPFVTFTSDPHPPSDLATKGPIIKDYAIIAAGAIILPNVLVGQGSIVAAGCVLTKDLPSEMIAKGVPGKVVGKASEIKLTGTEISAYPWRKHFHRGYPSDIVRAWQKEDAKGE